MKIILSILLMLVTTSVYAHEDPLQMPWPKGEKVPCRCDILAIPYDLCLKGIGREECFKKEKPKQSSEAPKVTLPKVVDPKNFVFKREPKNHWEDKWNFSDNKHREYVESERKFKW